MSSQEKNIYMELKLKELSIHMDRLNHKYHAIMQASSLSHEELTNYIENSNNFLPHEWEALQKEKTKLDEMLNLELSAIRDAAKTQKTTEEQSKIQHHWLFVR